MRLLLKLNLVLFLVFGLILLAGSKYAYDYLQRQAQQAQQKEQSSLIKHTNTMAAMMMEAALAMRTYTVTEIRPLLRRQMRKKFLPQSVPAYAATRMFGMLHKNYPSYMYKEATINPTNPKNSPADWERDIINDFRNKPGHKQLIGRRKTPLGEMLYMARPIVIRKKGCLVCHSRPAKAPKTLLALYGDNNGFGWKMNEVVGAQIISVPMPAAAQAADVDDTFGLLIGVSVGIFLGFMLLLNLLLYLIVIRPINKMARLADQVSKGDMDTPEFSEQGRDEIASMATSFNRMRRSLAKAITMIEEHTTGRFSS